MADALDILVNRSGGEAAAHHMHGARRTSRCHGARDASAAAGGAQVNDCVRDNARRATGFSIGTRTRVRVRVPTTRAAETLDSSKAALPASVSDETGESVHVTRGIEKSTRVAERTRRERSGRAFPFSSIFT